MRKLLPVILLAASMLSVSCTSLEPALTAEVSPKYNLVDPAVTDMTKYAKDYAECVEIANQNNVDVKDKVSGAARSAASRASFGLLGNTRSTEVDRGTVLRKCLTGRGYNVLR